MGGTTAEPLTWATIRRAQREDPTISPFIQSMEADSVLQLGDPNEMGMEEKVLAKMASSLSLTTETSNGEMPAGVLFYQHRAVLPRAIRTRVIAGCHGTGHVGIGKTFENVSTFYWWPAMYSTIREFVEHCAPCTLQRSHNLKRHHHHPLETSPTSTCSGRSQVSGRSTSMCSPASMATRATARSAPSATRRRRRSPGPSTT